MDALDHQYHHTVNVKAEVVDYGFIEVESQDAHQLCTACLCATRTTQMLDDVTLKQYYMNILAETQLELGEPVLQSPRLCWECTAHLKRLVRFREQVQESYRLLQPMLLTCDKEYLSEFLQTSVCRPGRLETCIAHAIDISPRDYDTQMMPAAYNDADDDTEHLLPSVKEERDLETGAAASENWEINIERPSTSTFRESASASVGDTVSEYLVKIPILRTYERNIGNDKQFHKTKAIRKKQVKKYFSNECEVCNKSFKLRSNLLRHKISHTGEKPFQCDVCQKSFSIKHNLVVHLRIHAGVKPFQCDVCQKSFSDKSQLLKHIRLHTSEKPFQCDICQKSYAQRKYLIVHMKKHNDGKQFQGKVYHKSFTKSHTRKNPLRCELCHKSFSQKSALKRHLRLHTGEKLFQCDVCQKSFSQGAHLLAHTRTHTGEKPFQCEMCQRSFAQQANLMSHVRIHTGEKPFQCRLCHKAFKSNRNLTRHMRTHTAEKRVDCTKHMRTHTGVKRLAIPLKDTY